MRRRRWRTAVLWVGCTLCVLIAVTFVASGWWLVAVQVPTPFGPCVVLHNGSVMVALDDQLVSSLNVGRIAVAARGLGRWNDWEATPRHVKLPLYALVFAVAIPTLLVWRVVPKFPSGHCRRCGYNLTGLTEARCPECGQPFETRGEAP